MIFHKAVENVLKKQFFVRYDDTGVVYYFSYQDFPGLKGEPYQFTSSLGHLMQGYFYSYDGADTDKLVIFEHGFGGGHRSYMKEIEMLCRAGYKVFAYDHTGCMESGGESTRCFCQSLQDLDDCLKALKADSTINTADISVMGHSWGGYSALNICALHPDVKKIVVLSGFISSEKMINQFFTGILKGYRKDILQTEKDTNPQYAGYDAIESLQNGNTQALLIYSDNDPLVKKEVHYDELYNALKENSNINFLLVSGKGHNPNYTDEAVASLAVLSQRTGKEGKNLKTDQQKADFRDSFDWNAMTAQDEEVWNQILAFLK